VDATNGGLVCFVFDTTKNPLTVVVINLLTGKKVELPCSLYIYDAMPTIQPTILQLRMNQKNNEYKFFLVGYIQSAIIGAFVFLMLASNKQECFFEQKMEVETMAIGGRIELDVPKNK